MNDLKLWNDLAALPADDFELGEQILEFAADRTRGKLKQDRWVYIGDLIRVLPSQQPPVQQAILQMLVGMEGKRATEAIVAAITNAYSPEVTETAIETLVKNGPQFEWQLVHAFLSHDPKIRCKSIERINSPTTAFIGLHFLADSNAEIGKLALERIYGLKLPIAAIGSIHKFWRSEVISKQQAQWLVFGIDDEQIVNQIEEATIKSGIPMKMLDTLFRVGQFPEFLTNSDPNADLSQWLVELLCDPILNQPLPPHEIDAVKAWQESMFKMSIQTVQPKCAFLLALLWWLHQQTEKPQAIIDIATSHDIRVAWLDWIPKSQRRSALASLFRKPYHKDHRQSKDALKLIEKSTLIFRESGQLDLAVIGSLLRCVSAPVQTAESILKKEQIVAAFLESPEDSIPFFDAPLSNQYLQSILEGVWKLGNGRKHRVSICILLALNLSGSRIEILDCLSKDEIFRFLLGCLEKVQSLPKPLPRNRLTLLARRICDRLIPEIRKILDAIVNQDNSHENALCIELLNEIAADKTKGMIVAYAKELDEVRTSQLLELINHSPGIPYSVERDLVAHFEHHQFANAATWAKEKAESAFKKNDLDRKIASSAKTLAQHEQDSIANCTESKLGQKIKPALNAPSIGLVSALESRFPPTKPNAKVICALVGCHDSLDLVDTQASLYSADTPSAPAEMVRDATFQWNNQSALPLLANATLRLWETHLFRVDAAIERLCDLTEMANKMKTPAFAAVFWRAASRLADVQAARNKTRFSQLVSPTLVETCIDQLRKTNGEVAAEILIRIHLNRPDLTDEFRGRVTELLPELANGVRQALIRWVSAEGITTASQLTRIRSAVTLSRSLKDRIAHSNNIWDLKRWCGEENWKIVAAASDRLLRIGDAGIEAIIELLTEQSLLPRYDLVCECIPFFNDSLKTTINAFELLQEFATESSTMPYRKFLIASQLLQTDYYQGNNKLTETLIDSINCDAALQWFVASDWDLAVSAVSESMDAVDLAIRVSTSSQSQAYIKAINYLTSGKSFSRRHVVAVEEFLQCGTLRAYDSRLAAAKWLSTEDSSVGVPILAAQLEEDTLSFRNASFDDVKRFSVSVIATGCRKKESNLNTAVLRAGELSRSDANWMWEWIVANAGHVFTIDQTLHRLRHDESENKTRKIARTFKWGIEQAYQLLNQPFRISMLADEDLGYTRLNENRVFVNILPMLNERKNGQKIVEGLILHELGHHIYHKGQGKQKIWDRAEKEGLHGLLNLVSDEHLERNLRTEDRAYDSRLKQLSSFAFQHSKKSYPIQRLLNMLNVHALEVLSKTKLTITDDPVCVEIDSGLLLRQLEQSGSSFSRFFRALRMGLGNRFDDPKVEAALKLFNRSFRKSNMRQLYDIALKLKDIFQEDAGFVNFINQDALVCPDALERARSGRGISDEEIEQEIRRITSKEELERSQNDGRGIGGRAINVIDQIDFTPITHIVRAPYDATAAMLLSKTVAAQARVLRSFLVDLGQKHVQQRRRLSGYRLDRQAINRLITRQDPRMMIARQREFQNDLFIGVAIDCSGSMAYNDNMDLAKRFAVLLAEAVRDVDDIDLRMFGFTDCTIFDVGDHRKNSVFSLHAGGGNNDAAALWHAAQEAIKSNRKSKLLIMISDGLPTECSVDSLRTLVRKLTQNFGICCAQLAVEELEEVCFPNYVLVKSESETGSIRKFGATIAKLVKKTISN